MDELPAYIETGVTASQFNDKVNPKSTGKIIPTSSDFEKSILGNNRIPPTKPIIVETIAFFSLNDFE